MKNTQKSLRENFASCERMVAMYLTGLGTLVHRSTSFPRIIRLVPESPVWRIGEIVPASPEYLRGGMASVETMLREELPGESYTLNLFMVAIRKDRDSQQIAFMVLAGDSSGERALYGGIPGSEWREVEERMAFAMFRLPESDAPDDAPIYSPTLRRVQQRIEQALPALASGPANTLAVECLDEALKLTSSAVAEVLDEVHQGIVANLDASSARMEEVQAAIFRAVKAKDKMYNRLFGDYQKVQVQAKGFQNRIQQLQAELKKVGQRKVMPGAPSAEAGSLAERLDTLF